MHISITAAQLFCIAMLFGAGFVTGKLLVRFLFVTVFGVTITACELAAHALNKITRNK